MQRMPIFLVENFGVSFSQYTKGITRKDFEVITNLDIDLYAGEILGVVGASGSGKSLLAHAILGLLPDNATTCGKMFYKGEELSQRNKEELRGKSIALIPQSVNYLDPLAKVGKQIRRSLNVKNRERADAHVKEMLKKYGLAEEVFDYYPHQLSGGMARKVLLCIALATDCDIIIADEPTPGLDEASMQEVLTDLRRVADSGKAVMMITHDINAACKIADRITIFYAGSTLESADAKDMTGNGENLRHPYTKALLKAMPSNAFKPIDGTQPLPGELPNGCLFIDRCPLRTDECCKARPELRAVRGGKVRCFHAS